MRGKSHANIKNEDKENIKPKPMQAKKVAKIDSVIKTKKDKTIKFAEDVVFNDKEAKLSKEHNYNIVSQSREQKLGYRKGYAMLLARIINDVNHKVVGSRRNKKILLH